MSVLLMFCKLTTFKCYNFDQGYIYFTLSVHESSSGKFVIVGKCNLFYEKKSEKKIDFCLKMVHVNLCPPGEIYLHPRMRIIKKEIKDKKGNNKWQKINNKEKAHCDSMNLNIDIDIEDLFSVEYT